METELPKRVRDIVAFVKKVRKATAADLERHFVGKGKMSKNTLMRYRDQAVDLYKMLKITIERDPPRKIYVPAEDAPITTDGSAYTVKTEKLTPTPAPTQAPSSPQVGFRFNVSFGPRVIEWMHWRAATNI